MKGKRKENEEEKNRAGPVRTALKQVQEHLLLHLVKGRDGWPKMDGWMDAWNGSEIAENGWKMKGNETK